MTLLFKIWDDISSQLLATFWSLTMYDLYVPERIYHKKIKELKEAPDKLKDNKDLNSTRRKKEAERLNNLMEKLQVQWTGYPWSPVHPFSHPFFQIFINSSILSNIH